MCVFACVCVPGEMSVYVYICSEEQEQATGDGLVDLCSVGRKEELTKSLDRGEGRVVE